MPPADQISGTLFTPLHFLFALVLAALIAAACIFCSRKGETFLKRVFATVWIVMLVAEVAKIL